MTSLPTFFRYEVVELRTGTMIRAFLSPMSTPYPTRVKVSFLSWPWLTSRKPIGGSGAGKIPGHFYAAGSLKTTIP